ncbi:hypothetical protein EW146_g5811 [Bondarzewia mesenterica]|uniref:Helitron helicase-like domain-containing protein n=1 Tax=Bondarzewia mesenterica TaxID=1095465 RepID=A0A4S4LW26_9AGAM|nr:hypothetical protein EW146_g5811 [Bondarzewia mesenterica]
MSSSSICTSSPSVIDSFASREQDLSKLSVSNLKMVAKGRLVLSRQERATKTQLIHAILARGSEDLITELRAQHQRSGNESTGQLGSEIGVLGRDEILKEVSGMLSLTSEERSSKSLVIDAILERGSADVHHRLLCAAGDKRKKRDHSDEVAGERKRTRCAEDDVEYDSFLSLPSVDAIHDCYREFYAATGNDALASQVCAVCARECGNRDDGLVEVPLDVIPNGDRLRPKRDIGHPRHVLTNGMLLEEKGLMKREANVVAVKICAACMSALNKTGPHTPPKYSLANNLWIGDVPWEIRVLTVPEQLLIALLYPRVYVFKLMPKGAQGSRDFASLQRGMRGTVSTYEQDFKGVAEMTEGRMMPRPPSVLALVMSVTFIGQGALPKDWLRMTFKVRRSAVRSALQWLKKNNAKYFGDIEICESRLALLPEDDVPQELLTNVKQSEDVGICQQESEGYVPQEDTYADFGSDDSNAGAAQHVDLEEDRQSHHVDDSASVVPLQVCGTVDTDLTNVTANELMLYGLSNLWNDGVEGGYAIKHGKQPVKDYGRPRPNEPHTYNPNGSNFFEKAFPALFPYGRGGIEADREVSLSFTEHARHLLRYHDRRFRSHETFPFVVFGIEQRRDALQSARIQMRRKNFEADSQLLSTITKEKLAKAQEEEDANRPLTDLAVRLLRKQVHATAARVKGSDSARHQLRSQIWSTSAEKGPPSMWVTINPCDLHDPIAQVFAGEDIDMDQFIAASGPDKVRRAENIANDPYAASKFFHFLINTVFESLFRITVSGGGRIEAEKGVLGKVAAYFGTVESQGRGSLHLHLLIWLEGAPSSRKMQDLLRFESFRQRVTNFIAANIRAFAPGVGSKSEICNLPNETEIAYGRPPNPDSSDYNEQLRQWELRVIRCKQRLSYSTLATPLEKNCARVATWTVGDCGKNIARESIPVETVYPRRFKDVPICLAYFRQTALASTGSIAHRYGKLQMASQKYHNDRGCVNGTERTKPRTKQTARKTTGFGPPRSMRVNNRVIWTAEDDKILVKTLMKEREKGGQTKTGMVRTSTYSACEKALADSELKSGGSAKDHTAIGSRWKKLKEEFKNVKQLREQAGWDWNPKKSTVTASGHVWASFIADHSWARQWQQRSFPLYNDMFELVEGDHAAKAGKYGKMAMDADETSDSTDSMDEENDEGQFASLNHLQKKPPSKAIKRQSSPDDREQGSSKRPRESKVTNSAAAAIVSPIRAPHHVPSLMGSHALPSEHRGRAVQILERDGELSPEEQVYAFMIFSEDLSIAESFHNISSKGTRTLFIRAVLRRSFLIPTE